jgi:hypothetical protein
VETGGPYESEIEMLRKALKKLQPQKGLPFVADKGYDAVDIIESLLDRGFEPAIRIKAEDWFKLQVAEGGLSKKGIHCLCYSLEFLIACNLLIFVISVWYLALWLR